MSAVDSETVPKLGFQFVSPEKSEKENEFFFIVDIVIIIIIIFTISTDLVVMDIVILEMRRES